MFLLLVRGARDWGLGASEEEKNFIFSYPYQPLAPNPQPLAPSLGKDNQFMATF